VLRDLNREIRLYESQKVLERGIDLTLVVPDIHERECRELPLVKVANFRNRDIELIADAILEAFKDRTFLFERLGMWDEYPYVKDADVASRFEHDQMTDLAAGAAKPTARF